jgi:hypothetical protein
MTPLRRRLTQDMQLHNFATGSVNVDVDCVARFARHFAKSPESLGPEDVRGFLLHLIIEQRRVFWSYDNLHLQALAFSPTSPWAAPRPSNTSFAPGGPSGSPSSSAPTNSTASLPPAARSSTAPRRAHDCLRRRPPRRRGRRTPSQRHRQSTHGPPRPPGQGPQGPLCHALARAPGDPPGRLEAGTPADLALPQPLRRRAAHARRRDEGVPPGPVRAWRSTSPSTPCGTASPPTCSRPAPT